MKREALDERKNGMNEEKEGVELTEEALAGINGGAVDALCRKCLICPKRTTCRKPERFKTGCNNDREITPNKGI